jgi:hypothetical protein
VRRAAAAPVLVCLLAVAGCGAGEPPAKDAAEVGAEPGEPRPDVPAPPSPAPALNAFAESCLHQPPPADETGAFATGCFSQLLETLRATIGVAQVPQAEIEQRLDDAELAVRRLSASPAAADAASRAGQAAGELLRLAGALALALDGAEPPALRPALAAAEAISPQLPLAEQGAALVTYFRAADDVVRPLVRGLEGAADGAPPAPG